MEQPIRVGLMGLGTVGSSVVQLLEANQEDLFHRSGKQIVVEKVLVKHPEKDRSIQVPSECLTDQSDEILKNERIDLVIEVMGGIEPARSYILEALKHGKHVITANKDLMALHGEEILSVATEKGCDVFYEASVAGGIPVLRALTEGLSSDRVTKIVGIVNGTTNYILSEMLNKEAPFEKALAQAQELGYAEADPTADVEGLDAARKVAILATLGFRTRVSLNEVFIRGIGSVTLEDVRFAMQLGYILKLVGIAQRDEDKVEASVQPVLLPEAHPLASVNGVFNAVYIYGEAVGETMFYGPGAGGMPTATAVVADLVTAIHNIGMGVSGQKVVRPYQETVLKSSKEVFSKHFLRLRVADHAGVMARLTGIFAEVGVSLEKVLQVPGGQDQEAEIVLVTHRTSQYQLEEVCHRMEELPVVHRLMSHYRVEGGED
ncbi:homoserine dehydrogenase [Melghirimyces algeriensis]|uniref:Homoserine dehydrogenase n=1 Tax=Melghirimyces algeriensis TaxID=910412 RepID=A0A521ATP7_9BACL|nr:homoserine dehydrogenase [Melghirimyces algeriensis]SMO37990.1 homoserine dehydrogenase [Melghirimyces algeriensis]